MAGSGKCACRGPRCESVTEISFGGVDQKAWQLYSDGAQNALFLGALNDAEGSQVLALQINRGTGTAISSVTFPNGNVGIGTTSPGAKLTVGGLTGTAMSSAFQVGAGSLGTIAGNELVLASIGGITSNSSALGVRLERESSGSDWTSSGIQLAYDVDNTPRAGAYIELSHTGNVGIGQNPPSYKLDVSGTGNFSQPVIVGTPTASNMAATKSYVDSAIASVTSTISGTAGYIPNPA